MDLVELDAASNNRVENIREITANAALVSPGRRKVYLLDEVHMLSTAASNALLKTLEEPPSHVVFILATTDPQKVLPTIRSRTQHVELNLVGPAFLDFLSISLTHVDSGQTFKLIDRPTDDGSGTCSRLDIVEGRVWDAAPQTSLCDSTPNSPVSFRPVDPLGALDGLPLNSLWKLSIENFVALRENGSLGYWCVKNMRVP